MTLSVFSCTSWPSLCLLWKTFSSRKIHFMAFNLTYNPWPTLFCKVVSGVFLNWQLRFSQSVQSLSHVWLYGTPWTAAHQASLSIANSRTLLKLMSIELVMPSNHLILYCPLLLLPSVFPSISVFSNESVLRISWPKYWSFSFGISPSNVPFKVQDFLKLYADPIQ